MITSHPFLIGSVFTGMSHEMQMRLGDAISIAPWTILDLCYHDNWIEEGAATLSEGMKVNSSITELDLGRP